MKSKEPQTRNVTVSSRSGVVPTGTVHLVEGSRTRSTATLVNGKAVLSSPPLAVGRHSFTAEYAGDVYDLPAISTAVVQTISRSSRCIRLEDPVAEAEVEFDGLDIPEATSFTTLGDGDGA